MAYCRVFATALVVQIALSVVGCALSVRPNNPEKPLYYQVPQDSTRGHEKQHSQYGGVLGFDRHRKYDQERYAARGHDKHEHEKHEKRAKHDAHKKPWRDQPDVLRVVRCDAKCWNLHKPIRNECVRACMSVQHKPGFCARSDSLSAWDAACVQACTTDARCPGVLKCCRHGCGATCQIPQGLDNVPGLPAIPANITVLERRRGRAVRVRWPCPHGATCPSTSGTSPVIYLLEERHHVGRHFIDSRLGEWTARQRSQRLTVSLKSVVKPGRWYQFRVAAINENGTRGFSLPSAPFSSTHHPRPPGPPLALTVQGLTQKNGSLGGTLRWKPPASSDLPVHKYKVYWSRRLKGVDQELNSVLVHQHTVGKDQTMFELEGLQPKYLYFLQVQALTQFGTTKLKSEKAAIILNTTTYTNDTVLQSEGNSSKRSAEQGIEDLHVPKIFWSNDQLFAKVAWKPVLSKFNKPTRYIVEWWTQHCDDEEQKLNSVTTDVPRYKIYDLRFKCKYYVKVKKISNDGGNARGAIKSFITPSCEQMKLHTKSEKVTCNKK